MQGNLQFLQDNVHDEQSDPHDAITVHTTLVAARPTYAGTVAVTYGFSYVIIIKRPLIQAIASKPHLCDHAHPEALLVQLLLHAAKPAAQPASRDDGSQPSKEHHQRHPHAVCNGSLRA
jgi:hypothetical protein